MSELRSEEQRVGWLETRFRPIASEAISVGRKGQTFEVGIDHPRQIFLGWKGGMMLYLDFDECLALRDWLNRAIP